MTMGSNRPSLADVQSWPLGDIAALPPEHLALLQEDSDAAMATAKAASDWIAGAIALRYADRAAAARRAEGKDTGTVRFTDGGVAVIADLPKRVEWDQSLLAAVVARIRASGDDPSEYVETAFKVPERKYTAWPETIRSAFAPARTVKAGKPSFTLLRDPDG